MKPYHKIQSIFKRDSKTHRFIDGKYSTPEIEYLANQEWIWDEKIDGTNIRVQWDGAAVRYQGKTDNAQIPKHLYERLCSRFTAEALKEAFPDVTEEEPVCLYGEGFGVKIQRGGKYIPDGADFCLFDVKIGNWWLKREAVEGIAFKMNLPLAPIVGQGTIDEAIKVVKAGLKSTFGDFKAEGLVLRPKVALFTRSGARVITKVKGKDFDNA
jgi:hypothetical protein